MDLSLSAPIAVQCTSNELIGDVVEVVADDLRLRADTQYIVPDSLDQRGLPAGRHSTERVPCMAGDQAEGSAPSSRST